MATPNSGNKRPKEEEEKKTVRHGDGINQRGGQH